MNPDNLVQWEAWSTEASVGYGAYALAMEESGTSVRKWDELSGFEQRAWRVAVARACNWHVDDRAWKP